jgi:hypothetical protein
MANRIAIFLVCALVLLVGPAATAQADSTTQLPFSGGAWLAVDPSGQHVFVSGGPGNSSIVVLTYAGKIVKTITGQAGASQMALNPATHTLYVALHDATAISEINTQTLTETKRFSTSPYPNPSSLVIAGGKLWFSCFQSDGEGCHGIISANLDGTGMAPAPAPVASYFFATELAAGGPGNKYLAAGDSYQEPPDVDVYNVSGATPTLVSHVHDPDGGSAEVRDMAFSPSGANLLLACGAPYFVESLSTTTLQSSAEYPTGPYPISVAVTSNGKFVAGGINTNAGPDVFVYPAGSTTPVRKFQVGNDDLTGIDHGLAFSPDASRLFAVAHDATTGHLAFHVLSQPTIPLKPSSTSATGSAKTVRYGGHASVKVHLSGPASGKVDLYATTSGATKQLVATATATSGAATFTVTPRENTTYVAQFEEGSGYATSASGGVRITVSPVISISTRKAGKGRLHGHRVSRTLFTAKVKPARPNEPLGFVVQRHIKRRWRTVGTGQFPADLTGTVHAFFLTNRVGPCRVRVSYAGDADYVKSKSAWKKFRTPRVR